MLVQENENVVVRESPMHGLGVFAAREFAAGEVIFERDESREAATDSDLPEGAKWEEVCAWLDDGRTVLIDAPARYHNHSCDPNTFIRHLGPRAEIVALRQIDADEELTTDYQLSGRGKSVWPCNCGSARCRGVVGPNFWALPVEQQVDYLPLISQALKDSAPARIEALRRAARAIREEDTDGSPG